MISKDFSFLPDFFIFLPVPKKLFIHLFFVFAAISWKNYKNSRAFLSFSLSCTFFQQNKRKLLAVLQKFTNNTQSETSSMAFTNFHSCLKNSLLFVPFRYANFFQLGFAACCGERAEMKKHGIMNNCSLLKRSFVEIASRTTKMEPI
jgi:hypothetical protein